MARFKGEFDMGMDHPSDDEYDKERWRDKERSGGLKNDAKNNKYGSRADGKPDIGSGVCAAANASRRCLDDAYAKKGIENRVPRSPDVIAAEEEAAKKRLLAEE